MSIKTNVFSKRSKILTIIALSSWALFYWLKIEYCLEGLYQIGTALTVFLLILAIHLSTLGCFKIFSFIFMGIAMSNLIDEMFYNPSVIEWNDIFAVAVFTGIGFIRYARKTKLC